MGQLSKFYGGVFISYRRSHSAGNATRLHDALARELGPDRVFLDIKKTSIPVGTKFTAEIKSALKRAHLILILIEPGWLECIEERAKLPDEDWVLNETALALKRYRGGALPELHVLLLSGAHMPKESELPELIRELAKVNSFQFSEDEWTNSLKTGSSLLNEIKARVPQQAERLRRTSIECLTTECRANVLEKLKNLSKHKCFESLGVKWEESFLDSRGVIATDRLEEFRSCITRLNEDKELSRSGFKLAQVEILRKDCVDIVSELFRLGACDLVSRLGHTLHTLGNYGRPARLRGAETQAFAVSYCQGKRRAQIDSINGGFNIPERFSVKNVLDQGTVVPGINQDQESNMLKQLWATVPEFHEPSSNRASSAYPVFDKNNIRSLSIRLNAMARDATSTRVMIAFQAEDGNSAHDLRVWLASLDFDVGVLVRSGHGANQIERQERELLSAAWACLKQIERLNSGRKVNER